MISASSSGSFSNLEKFLKKMLAGDIYRALDSIAREGVRALSANTPVSSGQTAASWDYEIVSGKNSHTIHFTNSHRNGEVHIAILLQYGHGTGTGGYVQGRDYINPALKPIFDKMANEAWKAVTSA